MKSAILTTLSLALVGLAPSPIRAQVAQTSEVAPLPQIAYQGRLTEGSTLVTGQRAFVFSILDATGSELWNSGSQALTVDTGLYSVVLGTAGMPPIQASILGRSGLKLRVIVGGATLSPDVDLIPAFQARSAWEVTGAFTGDLSGTQNQILIASLQGIPLDLTTTAPNAGQGLIFSGTKWVPGTVVGTPGAKGDKGDTGLTGNTGPQGAKGAKGDKGDQGLPGLPGTNGTNGSDGRTILNGVGSPVASAAAGAIGDFYLDHQAHVLYGPKMGADWVGLVGVSLVGPQGDAGAAGAQGIQGVKGDTGSQGEVGSQGPTGAAGPQGPAGAAGVVTDGAMNTKGGTGALAVITSARSNTALGLSALAGLKSGQSNIAIGTALTGATTGSHNLGIGQGTLPGLTTGSGNIAVGGGALSGTNGSYNTALGYQAGNYLPVGSSSHNIFIGYRAGINTQTANASNNITIGSPGDMSDDGTIRIGTTGTHTRTFISGVLGTNVTQAGWLTFQHVMVDQNGQLGAGPLVVSPITPSASADPGIDGEIRADANYVYLYLAGVWRRAALSTW